MIARVVSFFLRWEIFGKFIKQQKHDEARSWGNFWQIAVLIFVEEIEVRWRALRSHKSAWKFWSSEIYFCTSVEIFCSESLCWLAGWSIRVTEVEFRIDCKIAEENCLRRNHPRFLIAIHCREGVLHACSKSEFFWETRIQPLVERVHPWYILLSKGCTLAATTSWKEDATQGRESLI